MSKIAHLHFFAGAARSPALKTLMVLTGLPLLWSAFLFVSNRWASARKTWSCLHLYCPWDRATRHEERTCSRLAGLWQRSV